MGRVMITFFWSDKHGQNVWNKVKRSRKIRQK